MTAEFANLMISCTVSTFIEPVSSKKKRNAATKRKPKRQLSGAIRDEIQAVVAVVALTAIFNSKGRKKKGQNQEIFKLYHGVNSEFCPLISINILL